PTSSRSGDRPSTDPISSATPRATKAHDQLRLQAALPAEECAAAPLSRKAQVLRHHSSLRATGNGAPRENLAANFEIRDMELAKPFRSESSVQWSDLYEPLCKSNIRTVLRHTAGKAANVSSDTRR